MNSSDLALQPTNPAGSTAVARPLIDYNFQAVVAAPPKQRWVLRLMVMLFVGLAIGLALAKVDVIIAADGKLVTSDNIIVVQPFETSVVRSVLVKMGQQVHQGDILATLDPTFSQADEEELTAKLRGAQALYDRLSAELDGREYAPSTPNPDETTQLDIWHKRQEEYAAHINSSNSKEQELRADIEAHKTEAAGLKEQINLSNQANEIYESLVQINLASKLKLIETTEHLVDAKTRLSTNLGEQNKLTQQVAGAAAEQAAFISEWRRKTAEELAKARNDRDGPAAQLSKAQMRHRLSVLRAPHDATVLEVADRPEGSVIREAETLFRLVPSDARVVAEIRIDTRDVARLKVGDPVTVKFEALPWQQYGLGQGILKSLTPDTLDDDNPRQTTEDMTAPNLKPAARQSTIHYRAQVELTELKLRNLPPDFVLRPGMRLLADIKLGQRSVLEYVLNPVTRVISESMREP